MNDTCEDEITEYANINPSQGKKLEEKINKEKIL